MDFELVVVVVVVVVGKNAADILVVDGTFIVDRVVVGDNIVVAVAIVVVGDDDVHWTRSMEVAVQVNHFVRSTKSRNNDGGLIVIVE